MQRERKSPITRVVLKSIKTNQAIGLWGRYVERTPLKKELTLASNLLSERGQLLN